MSRHHVRLKDLDFLGEAVERMDHIGADAIITRVREGDLYVRPEVTDRAMALYAMNITIQKPAGSQSAVWRRYSRHVTETFP